MGKKYTEAEIERIQNELSNQVEKENDFLTEIEQLSESIAHRLVQGRHTRERFLDTDFIFNLRYDDVRKIIYVMRTDPVKLAIGMGHYRPAIFAEEYNENLTMDENVYIAVKAALCSKAGIINVDEAGND